MTPRPICARYGTAESRVVCGHHKLPLCMACQPVHHVDGCCYYNAAPALHLIETGRQQLTLKFGDLYR